VGHGFYRSVIAVNNFLVYVPHYRSNREYRGIPEVTDRDATIDAPRAITDDLVGVVLE